MYQTQSEGKHNVYLGHEMLKARWLIRMVSTTRPHKKRHDYRHAIQVLFSAKERNCGKFARTAFVSPKKPSPMTSESIGNNSHRSRLVAPGDLRKLFWYPLCWSGWRIVPITPFVQDYPRTLDQSLGTVSLICGQRWINDDQIYSVLTRRRNINSTWLPTILVDLLYLSKTPNKVFVMSAK